MRFAGVVFLIGMFATGMSQAGPPQQGALAQASYNNTLIQLTPMLFHRIELGMTYAAVVNTVGKSALYCDSGESTCLAEQGSIATSCLEREFIQPNKTWFCHWDGKRSLAKSASRLDVWFVGVRTSQVLAIMDDGNIYRRDSANIIGLERHSLD